MSGEGELDVGVDCDRDKRDSVASSIQKTKQNNAIKMHDSSSSSSSDVDDEDEDVNSTTRGPSVLKIMANNHGSITHTVSLIHKEAARFNVSVEPSVQQSIKSMRDDSLSSHKDDNESDQQVSNGTAAEQTIGSPPATTTTQPGAEANTKPADPSALVQNKEIEGLSSFLEDSSVRQLIKSVAGGETTAFIDKTLSAVNSRQSIQEKRAVLSGGIKQLHSDLLTNKDKITRDPLFSLALGIAGLNKRSINFD